MDPRAVGTVQAMSQHLRRSLVGYLESVGAIKTRAVRDAFLAIPRETFIPTLVREQGLDAAYLDEAYLTKTDDRGDAISSSSQPQIMALMLEELRVLPGHRVLEIGAGSGYNAALLSHLVGRDGAVTTVELDPDLAAGADDTIRRSGYAVRVEVGDGRNGFPASAPYDRIVVTASSLDVPKAFLQQLRDGGLLVLPLRITDSLPFQQIVITFQRAGGMFTSVSVIRGGFMRLRERPNDVSLPWAEAPIGGRGNGARHAGSLSGAAWGALPDHVQSRLISLFAGAPSSRPLGMRLRSWQQWELQTFIAVSLSEEILVGVVRDDLAGLSFLGTALPAVIDPGGSGLAQLAGRKTVSRIDAFGELGPEHLLQEAVDDWRRRGRPHASRLNVIVSYGSMRSRSWRIKSRGGALIGFDW